MHTTNKWITNKQKAKEIIMLKYLSVRYKYDHANGTKTAVSSTVNTLKTLIACAATILVLYKTHNNKSMWSMKDYLHPNMKQGGEIIVIKWHDPAVYYDKINHESQTHANMVWSSQ